VDDPTLAPMERPPVAPVPWRTILATVAVVSATYLGYLLVRQTGRILIWVGVALFFAVILGPPVDIVQRRLRVRRAVATTLVFVIGIALVGVLLYAFIRPVVDQVSTFVDELPEYVDDAQNGRGPIGELIDRYDLDQWLEDNRDRLQDSLSSAGAPALDVARGVFSTFVAMLTIGVLSFLMSLRGPQLLDSIQSVIPNRHTRRVRVVATDAARAVSGYMLGNFLISLIAGTVTYIALLIVGVPYAEVLALFVAFTDLIPLIGATLGAIPTVGLAFLHSTTAGIVMLIFYVVYQQFENHVLQPTVMSRTVQVNPLTVLISVLIGVELYGFLGALLAIPVAGIVQVVARNLWDERHGAPKEVPTVGVDERPADQPPVDGVGGIDGAVGDDAMSDDAISESPTP
jgi:predicted PurR-regulated permease PerM